MTVFQSFLNTVNVIPHIKNGRLKGLAITGEKRTVSLPQLATYAEAGLPGYDPKNRQGILAPARAPSAIVTRLSGEVRKILDMRDIRERLVNSGMEPFHTGPEKMAAQMKSDYAETVKVIKTANIKIKE